MKRDEFELKVVELWTKSRVPLTEANLQAFTDLSPKKVVGFVDELLDSGVLDIDTSRQDLCYKVAGHTRSPDGPTTVPEYEKKRALIAEAKRRILARRRGEDPDDGPAPEPESANKRSKRSKRSEKRAEKKRDEAEESKSLTLFGGDDKGDEQEGEEDDEGLEIGAIVSKAAMMAGKGALVAMDKPLSALDRPNRKGDKSLLLSGGLSLFGPIGWLYAGSFREAVPATLAYLAVLKIVPSFFLAPFMFVGSAASGIVGLAYAWRFNKKRGRTPLLLKGRKKKKSAEDDGDE